VAAQWHDEAVLDELVGAEAAAAARVDDRAAAYLRTSLAAARAALQLADDLSILVGTDAGIGVLRLEEP
jgi:hypothetical protein